MSELAAPTAFPEEAPSAHAHAYMPWPDRLCGNCAAEASPHNGSDETELTTAGIRSNVNQEFHYYDFYNFMSFADFLAWVERSDGSEPDISHIQGR